MLSECRLGSMGKELRPWQNTDMAFTPSLIHTPITDTREFVAL